MATAPRTLFLATAFSLLAGAGAALADTRHSGTFDLYLKGLRAGTLTFSGQENATHYSATGRVQSAGLLALVRDIRYDAKSTGRITKTGFEPLRYEEEADTGKRQSQSRMEYRNGTPVVLAPPPRATPRPHDVDPATQRGTLDPMTAIFTAMRDVPRAEACTLNVVMFDGNRRSQITLDAPREKAGQLICTGEYRRVAGFSPREMAEKTRFPFELTYTPLENGMMRVTHITTDTLYGKAVLKRR